MNSFFFFHVWQPCLTNCTGLVRGRDGVEVQVSDGDEGPVEAHQAVGGRGGGRGVGGQQLKHRNLKDFFCDFLLQ